MNDARGTSSYSRRDYYYKCTEIYILTNFNMTRDKIKDIVYKCAANQFYDDDEFYTKMSESPDDGEDLLLYDEVGFDSLDMVEFIITVENHDKLKINLPDDLFDKEVTLRRIIDYIKENGK